MESVRFSGNQFVVFYSWADKLILFCGPMFVPALILSQPKFQSHISPLFGTDLYFTEIYRITISIFQCPAFFLEEACVHVLLPLTAFEAI